MIPGTPRRYQFEWILLGMALLTLGALLGYSAYAEYGEIEALDRDRLQVQARVIAENMGRQLDGVNNALVGVRDDLLQWNGKKMSPVPSRRLNVLNDVMPGVRTLLILDAGGAALASNRDELIGRNFSERDYFKVPRERPDPAVLYVSPPFKTVLGVVVIAVTRVLAGPEGEFAGVVTATLDPEYFNVLLRSVLYAPDMRAALTHWDGKAFLFMPPNERMVGADLAKPGSFFSQHRESGQSATLLTSTSIVSGEERMMASRTLERAGLRMDKPLVIHVSRNLSAIFADWRWDAYIKGWMFGVLVLITTLGLLFYQQRQRVYDRLESNHEAERKRAAATLQESERRYRTMIEWSPEAIAVHRGGKLIYVNPAAIKMFGARSAQDLIGKPILALIHPDFHQIVLARVKSIVDGGVNAPTIEEKFLKLDGTIIDVEIQGVPILYDGEPAVHTSIRDITERKRAEAAINIAAQRLQIALEGSQISVWETDLRTNQIWLDASWAAFLGMPPAETRSNATELLQLVHPDDRQRITAVAVRAMKGEIASYAVEHRVRAANGEWKWILSRGRVIERDAGGRPLRMSGTNTDINERKQADEKLHLAASVFTHAREGIVIAAPDGTIVDVNDTFSRITGYSRDEVVGRNERMLRSGRQGEAFYADLWRDLIEKGHWSGELWNRRKNGEEYAEMRTISAVRDAQGNTRQYVALFSDITAFKEHEKQLEHIAHYDALTGLPNRVLLADRLHQAMAQAHRRAQPLAVAYLDLDGFKAVNDRYGHDTGDQLLTTMAASMKQVLREGDTLSRLGGDEFVAVLLDLPDVEASVPMLARLLAAAAQPVHVKDLVLEVSASLGVTFYPQAEDVDADQLLRQADQAMYQAKLAGKNRYHVFDAEQDRSVRGHHESLERIRHALIEREFVLHYQPKVNMRTGTVIGAEALIRWEHPEKGLLPPAVFLPVIEDHPLAVEIGEWVIDTALTQMTLWQASGLDIPVSVNVGARQLQQAGFPERLRKILAAHPNVRSSDLELEVLETSALEDVVGVSKILEACREIGVMFALDDFGTGYSSLTYLKRLPVTLLKIDQSFVRDMLEDPDDLAILEGVIGLATAFGRQVIAEGVETVEHGEMLLQLGCELAQGYGIAPPMPARELTGWSATWRPDSAWINCRQVSRDDLRLLFASVEHRAWIAAIEAFLKGACEIPPQLDHHQCHFGKWLDAESLSRHGAQPVFQTIELLHRQVHALAAELCELQARGRNPEALARLGELHGLRDPLLEQMKALSQESRQ
jgi:diguanylate cyclase (GGDEF)-like protein/PAS domain S-box-containing protein